MTGPEHYRAAERLLIHAGAAELEGAGVVVRDDRTLELRTTAYARAARLTTRAGVHAHLALAAAAYDGLADNGGTAMFGRHQDDADTLEALEGVQA